jgi:hypothetical protein
MDFHGLFTEIALFYKKKINFLSSVHMEFCCCLTAEEHVSENRKIIAIILILIPVFSQTQKKN